MLMPGKSCRTGLHADPLLTPQQARERLRDQLRQAEQELVGVQMASMDELTLLSNRHGFTALAQLGLQTCRELEIPATLLYFKLDDYQRITGLYGHAEGDEALKTFADVLRIAFRENDVVGRLKRDCFAVLLTGSSAVEIVAIQARLKEMLEERNAMAHRRYGIRFSAGQVEIDPQENQSVEDLLAEVERVPGQ
ncbi:GGDEF domain-containing protein [Pseudomonas vancouverensis]|uniref:diguanylate cyclase n=1 Tax=Pseudomonas vancouverensis TaxID=95300 RepID=A0A1H2NKP1_PSEVA|nr:GGDEF domain-containing protein [Pseudomonas vancouverensis]KAB0495187.1 GGDEF domain-containing protein [Pseudomonas vancouverensis]TDB57052.1 GGDEF domain-containing protein [Pseudomonas vancouverensis]SDV05960.1 diguanylate cyclase (GGDEF) domain-containing protein [Pseudomonas vancouverensis]